MDSTMFANLLAKGTGQSVDWVTNPDNLLEMQKYILSISFNNSVVVPIFDPNGVLNADPGLYISEINWENGLIIFARMESHSNSMYRGNRTRNNTFVAIEEIRLIELIEAVHFKDYRNYEGYARYAKCEQVPWGEFRDIANMPTGTNQLFPEMSRRDELSNRPVANESKRYYTRKFQEGEGAIKNYAPKIIIPKEKGEIFTEKFKKYASVDQIPWSIKYRGNVNYVIFDRSDNTYIPVYDSEINSEDNPYKDAGDTITQLDTPATISGHEIPLYELQES